jgi:hypothetical protein
MFRQGVPSKFVDAAGWGPDDMRKVKPPVDGHRLDKDVTMLIGQSGFWIAEWDSGGPGNQTSCSASTSLSSRRQIWEKKDEHLLSQKNAWHSDHISFV